MKILIGALVGLLAVVATASTAFAQTVGLPHEFMSGAPAVAADVNENFRYVAPKNVIFVSPVDGGTATDNGDALKAALNVPTITAINGAPSATNRYRIQLAPGRYDVGSDTAFMAHFVDLVGSGDSTVVAGQVGVAGTVIRGSTGSELRSLRVEATASSTGRGIQTMLSTMTIRDVSVSISAGGGTAFGIEIDDSTVTLENVKVTVSGGTSAAAGMSFTDDSTVVGSGLWVTVNHNAVFATGIDVSGGSEAHLNNTRVTVTNGTTAGYECSALSTNNPNTSVVLRNSYLEVTGASATTFPIYLLGGATVSVNVHHSVMLNNSDTNFLRNFGSVVGVGASQVDGGTWMGTGTVNCSRVYSDAFADVACTNII